MATNSLSILFIDDDDEDYEIFNDVVSSLIPSATCHWANTLDKALTIVQGGVVPDYIFVDGYMPTMKASDCIPQLRQLKKLKLTPIVIYSGQSRSFLMEMKNEFQPIAMFPKPYSLEDLRKATREFFKQHL